MSGGTEYAETSAHTEPKTKTLTKTIKEMRLGLLLRTVIPIDVGMSGCIKLQMPWLVYGNHQAGFAELRVVDF
jgi:hypothetical protein